MPASECACVAYIVHRLSPIGIRQAHLGPCSQHLILMAYTVMAFIVVAYIVMAYVVMAYIVMAYIVMAQSSGYSL